MDILEKYKSITVNELSRSFPNHDLSNISFEFPRDSSNGDFSTNAALVLFKKLKIETRDVYNLIFNLFKDNDDFESIELAKNGFINFTVKDHVLHNLIRDVLVNKSSFGKKNIGNRKNYY